MTRRAALLSWSPPDCSSSPAGYSAAAELAEVDGLSASVA